MTGDVCWLCAGTEEIEVGNVISGRAGAPVEFKAGEGGRLSCPICRPDEARRENAELLAGGIPKSLNVTKH